MICFNAIKELPLEGHKGGIAAMISIRETTSRDLKDVQKLWADGDVMKFVGFPEGLHETDEKMAFLDGGGQTAPKPLFAV